MTSKTIYCCDRCNEEFERRPTDMGCLQLNGFGIDLCPACTTKFRVFLGKKALPKLGLGTRDLPEEEGTEHSP